MGHLDGLTLPAHKIHDTVLYTCLLCETMHSGPVEKAVFQKGEWVYSLRCKEAPGELQGHPESLVAPAEKTLFEVEIANGVGVRVRKFLEDSGAVHRLLVFEPSSSTPLFEGDPDSCLSRAKGLVDCMRKAAQPPFISPT